MSDSELLRLRNVLIYSAIACLNAAAVVAAALVAQGAVPALEAGGWAEPAKPILLAMLAVLVPSLASWLAANRPRLGSEAVAAQVDVLEKRGNRRRQMRVLPTAPGADEQQRIEHEQCGHPGLMAWMAPTRDGEMLDVLHVRHLDGRRFPAAANPTCDNCGAEILYVFARDGRWLARSVRQSEVAGAKG